MSTAVGDLFPQIRDYCRNSNLDNTRMIRAIDQAGDLINSQLGLPSQEKYSNFDFDQDQPTYSVPTGFVEPIFLRYQDEEWNENKRFSYRPAEYIHERVNLVTSDTRLYGFSAETGSWLMYVLAENTMAPMTIDTFDTDASSWVNTGDAGTPTNDIYVYKEGTASMVFPITVSGTSAILTTTITAQDLNTWLDIGHFKVWCYLDAVTHFTSVSFKWGTSAAKYMLQTVVAQADGTAFTVGWNQLDFLWSTATQVGVVDPHTITYYQFIFTYTGAFAGGTTFRLDYLRLMKPDTLVLSYYSGYKGTNSTGTSLTTFTASTDLFQFDNFDVGLKNLYAIYAAAIINPQILVDDTHAKEQYEVYSREYKRRYPRKRTNQLLSIPTLPRTSQSSNQHL
jgi:hypothetical protein